MFAFSLGVQEQICLAFFGAVGIAVLAAVVILALGKGRSKDE